MRHAASLDLANGRVTDFAVARRTGLDEPDESWPAGGAVAIVARGTSMARATSMRRSGSTHEEREGLRVARPLNEA